MDERPRNIYEIMETTPSFDLNRSVQSWRENLSQSPAFQWENLDELETHLRDSVATLQTQGLSTEEAFVVATGRIGKNSLLDSEFGKINSKAVWLDRMFWMLIGIQVWGFVSGLIGSISSSAVSLGLMGSHFDIVARGRTFPVVLLSLVRVVAIAGSLALCWWLIVRKGQTLGWRIEQFLHSRVTRVVTCCVLCVISLSGFVVNYGSQMLLFKLGDSRTVGDVATSMTYSFMLGWIIQAITLVVLTLILARKRLRLSKT